MQQATLELGISTTIIGLGVVFSVLVILSFTTWLLTTIVDGNIERKKAQEATKQVSAPRVSVPVTEAPPVPGIASGISGKTVAAIMAAVSLASERPLSQLHFTAIRRNKTAATAWSSSSTTDIIANRQAYL